MPKHTQKKRRIHHDRAEHDDVADSAVKVHAISVASEPYEDSIEACLAEMSVPINKAESFPCTNTTASNVALESSSASFTTTTENELHDPTLTKPHPLNKGMYDRILTWNRAMSLWQKTGSYTSGLLPSFDIEVTRHFKVQALSAFLLESCKGLKMPAFERWLIDSKLEEQARRGGSSGIDPVLSDATVGFDASQRLLEEILEAGMTRSDAKRLVNDLCRRTGLAIREISQQLAIHAGQVPLKKGDRIDLEGREPVLTLVYHRKHWAKPFCIKLNSTHYEKLRHMFAQTHGLCDSQDTSLRWTQAGKLTKLTHAFHELVMVLLLRYSSLSGGQLLLDLRGGGMQGAIHGQVFRDLVEYFPAGPFLESFGSPLNAFLPSFGSAFPDDIDWHFGSIGNFLNIVVTEGCCEANPPFAPGIMNSMVDRMERNLELADNRRTALTFVVVVPNSGDKVDSQQPAAKRFGSVALKKMIQSPMCRLHIILLAKEHGYVEGAQHMRPTRYKASIYDTSVIVLQSEVAQKEQTLDIKLFESKIRDSFASRHEAEIAQRQQDCQDRNNLDDN